MFKKIKEWFLGKVIMSKVVGKLAKHATTAIMGLLSTALFVEKIQPTLDQIGVTLDKGQAEAGLFVLLTGIFGAAWNYIQHRIFS